MEMFKRIDDLKESLYGLEEFFYKEARKYTTEDNIFIILHLDRLLILESMSGQFREKNLPLSKGIISFKGNSYQPNSIYGEYIKIVIEDLEKLNPDLKQKEGFDIVTYRNSLLENVENMLKPKKRFK
jgi:hypothetical protein